jgi:hypothetical protein
MAGPLPANWDLLPFRQSAGCESCLVGLRLVATVDEGGSLRRWIHGPVYFAAFVVVLADLRVEAPINPVLENVPRESEDHRRVL